MPFSDLLDSIDVRDSGQFNYHLGKLVPQFVRTAEDGYELTFAGEQVIGAAVSGVYTDTDVTVEAIDIGGCLDCGDTIEARYEAGWLDIECVDYDMVITDGLPAPPVLAASHDPENLPRVFNRFLLTRTQSVARGLCQYCGGRVESSLDTESCYGPFVQQSCQACGAEVGTSVQALVLDHPAVVSFLYEDDIDTRETMVWNLDWLFDTDVTVAKEDPLRVELRIEQDDKRLEPTLDETLSVMDVARSSGS